MVSVDWAQHWLVALAVDSSHMKLAVACSERSQEQLLARSEQTLQSTSTRSTSTDTTMSIIITMGTIIKLSMIELYQPWAKALDTSDSGRLWDRILRVAGLFVMVFASSGTWTSALQFYD